MSYSRGYGSSDEFERMINDIARESRLSIQQQGYARDNPLPLSRQLYTVNPEDGSHQYQRFPDAMQFRRQFDPESTRAPFWADRHLRPTLLNHIDGNGEVLYNPQMQVITQRDLDDRISNMAGVRTYAADMAKIPPRDRRTYVRNVHPYEAVIGEESRRVRNYFNARHPTYLHRPPTPEGFDESSPHIDYWSQSIPSDYNPSQHLEIYDQFNRVDHGQEEADRRRREHNLVHGLLHGDYSRRG